MSIPTPCSTMMWSDWLLYVHEHLDGNVVTIDLSGVTMTTTAAFARLLILRKRLLGTGRDLRLTGLAGEVLSLYHILHMDLALPRSAGEDLREAQVA